MQETFTPQGKNEKKLKQEIDLSFSNDIDFIIILENVQKNEIIETQTFFQVFFLVFIKLDDPH